MPFRATTVETISLEPDATYRWEKSEVGDKAIVGRETQRTRVFSRNNLLVARSNLGRIVAPQFDTADELIEAVAPESDLEAKQRIVIVTGNDPYCVRHEEQVAEDVKREAEVVVQVARMRVESNIPTEQLREDARCNSFIMVSTAVMFIILLFAAYSAYLVFLKTPG